MTKTIAPALLGVRRAGGGPKDVAPRVVGRLAVVTGASRGIGRRVAQRLAAAGARVVGIARGEDALGRLRNQIQARGGAFEVWPLDLRDSAAATRLGEQVVGQFGAPGLMISCAGHSIHRHLDESWDRPHDFTRLAGVNHLGPIALALPLLRAMTGRGTGHLISVSTVMVDVPTPGWTAYTGAEAAFEAWLDAGAPELRAAGVAVTSVRLPRVATAMSAPTAGRYPVPALSVDQAADAVCRAIAQRPRLVRPWWASAAGAVAGLAPGLTDRVWATVLRAGWRP
ncbi:MAG: SDR family NAD(P)-dependent oxidoreductase [Bifidobacteriaceae bacterium]|nr:SDR family NAD(P)-dependent oxidoreductase [Bifidobacteriaceae bacterium]